MHDNLLFVAGEPRTGTTWIAETLCALRGAEILWEPLLDSRHPNYDWRPQHLGEVDLTWYDALFRGSVSNAQTRLYYTLYNLPANPPPVTRWRIVKFTRAGRILPSLVSRFKPRQTIITMRHPVTAIRSHQARRWREGKSLDCVAAAARWAETYRSLLAMGPQPNVLWVINEQPPAVEELFAFLTEEELRIEDALGRPSLAMRTQQQWERPSSSSTLAGVDLTRAPLPPVPVVEIMNEVRSRGIDFYATSAPYGLDVRRLDVSKLPKHLRRKT